MHIKSASNEVVNLIYLLDNKNDIQKTKFLIYIFDLLNNNKIKNEEVIFNFDTIGYNSSISKFFIYYLVAIYNHYDLKNEIIIENENIVNINYDDILEIKNLFDKLNLIDKIDIINELIIEYHERKYFNEDLGMIKFSDILSSKDISNMISEFKKRLE